MEDTRIVAEGMTRAFPAYSRSWVALARIHAASGRTADAKEGMGTAFKLSPDIRLETLDDSDFADGW